MTGPIRVVTIDGVDSNMCCGTHVNNLAVRELTCIITMQWRVVCGFDMSNIFPRTYN